ncbi:MAG: EAL domain-containing protein [Tepidimonas sp.]|uniref:EAL domain-containing protein n=1 Tax=Tepidimonas sp. TaxID=2002775 RepID=UPI004054B3FA
MILHVPPISSPPDPNRVRSLLDAGSLHMHAQPIVDLGAGAVIGHEALVRPPWDCAWRTPDALFTAARREGCVIELEWACVDLALASFQALPGTGRLYVNLSADALVHGALHNCAAARRGAESKDLAGVVIELTEHQTVHDVDAVIEALAVWRTRGAELALDDFGDGKSSLRLWSELRPEYVKIDKYFVRHVHLESHKLKTLRALQQLAETFGSRLIAEGVEEPDELMVVRDLGIPLGQGYLLGRPQPHIQPRVPEEALAVLRSRQIAVLPQERQVANRGLTARALLVEAPALDANASHDDAFALLCQYPDLNAVALTDRGRPVGLMPRHALQELALQQRYFRELWGKRPCIAHANQDPLLVDINTPIEQLTEVLTSADQRYLRDGFIITENGCYVGLGTGEQLVRRVTEARIEAARHANPLTFLPGNVPITQHIERLLQHGATFAACYADLNHFKAFNDYYGYWRGDEMIRTQARCLSGACDPRRDFIGHVGGDDFVLLMQSPDWRDRLERAVAQFNQAARELYDEAAQQAGGIQAEDRHGVVRFHGFTTVSIGVVVVQPGQLHSAEEVANTAAAAKHAAKQRQLGVYVLDQPTAAAAAASSAHPPAAAAQ